MTQRLARAQSSWQRASHRIRAIDRYAKALRRRPYGRLVYREELRELKAERARQSSCAWQAKDRVEQLAAWQGEVAAHQADRARWLADHGRTEERLPAPTGLAVRAERRRADRAQARADRATRRSGRAARDQDLARDRLAGRDRNDHHQERGERGQDRALG